MYSSSGCRHYIEVKYVIDATFSSTNCTSYAVDAEFCLEFVNILCNHMLTLNELGWKGIGSRIPKMYHLFYFFIFFLMSESYGRLVVGGWAVLL